MTPTTPSGKALDAELTRSVVTRLDRLQGWRRQIAKAEQEAAQAALAAAPEAGGLDAEDTPNGVIWRDAAGKVVSGPEDD